MVAGKKALTYLLKIIVSLGILSVFLVLSKVLTGHFHWQFPAPLSAMLALFVCLMLGIIKLSWLLPGGTPLLNYMPLFFVPAAAKVVEHSALIAQYWLILLLCLFLVPIISLLLIGHISERINKART